MKFNDLLLGLVVIAGGVAIYISALDFTPIPGQSYGAETMPRAIAFLAIGTGLFLSLRAVMRSERVPRISLAEWAQSPRALASLALTVALVIAYILFSDSIGFLPMALIVMVTLMLALGARLVIAAPAALVAAVVIQEAFGGLLLVPLPPASVFGFQW
jgi:hypothetical protein